jgi:hypothetical protein
MQGEKNEQKVFGICSVDPRRCFERMQFAVECADTYSYIDSYAFGNTGCELFLYTARAHNNSCTFCSS